MDYHEFSNASLSMMHFGARGALAADDELKTLGEAARFCVRETQGWKRHIAELEAEMIRRGMAFEVIDFSTDLDCGAESLG
jgi:hypothetical protein